MQNFDFIVSKQVMYVTYFIPMAVLPTLVAFCFTDFNHMVHVVVSHIYMCYRQAGIPGASRKASKFQAFPEI